MGSGCTSHPCSLEEWRGLLQLGGGRATVATLGSSGSLALSRVLHLERHDRGWYTVHGRRQRFLQWRVLHLLVAGPSRRAAHLLINLLTFHRWHVASLTVLSQVITCTLLLLSINALIEEVAEAVDGDVTQLPIPPLLISH